MPRKRKAKRGRPAGQMLQGKLFKINGKVLRLYTRAKLIEAFRLAGIPRGSLTLRNWENTGILPPALVRVNNICYYTQEQINAIVRVALECGVRRGFPIEKTGFSERVKIALQKVNERLFLPDKEAEE